MVQFILQRDAHRHRALMERVYRFRHDFFVDGKGWSDLRRSDGREIDNFDAIEGTVHLVGCEADRVVSYCRLLPTTGPHLLRDVYPEIMAGAAYPTGPGVYEWTRCAVDPAKREGRHGVDVTTARMFVSTMEACAYLGLDGLIVETHPLLLTRALEAGWLARPLMLPVQHKGETMVAFYAEYVPQSLAAARRVFGIAQPILALPDGRPVLELPDAAHVGAGG